MSEKKRLTAIKTSIGPIIHGKYIAQEGFEPNYVQTEHGRLSRVRVLGTVVDKFVSESGKLAALTIDDGTATIRSKAFGGIAVFSSIETGAIVDVVGRVKEYQGEIYLSPELTTVVDINFEIMRQLELIKHGKHADQKMQIVSQYKNQISDMDELKRVLRERHGISEDETASMAVQKDDNKEKVLEFIEKLDKGEGCEYADLISGSGLTEDVIDAAVNELLNEGTCFEPRPGKIKKL